ncbi:MAG TPA: lyase family protein [Streptosporangiaceae bacterium]|jgi:3-carboxy-cis,cis-muconate cycloisomerase
MPEPGGLFGGVFGRGGADVSDTAWLQAMLDTEAALARALERAGLAAPGAGAAVTAAARADHFDVDDLGRQAALTGNPVPALVRALHALLPPEAAAAVHRGATSQDIIDTAMMLLARSATRTTLTSLGRAADAAAGLGERHQDTIMIGRTLLQQAVPVTFGLVAAGWLTSLDDAWAALALARLDRLTVQFGGAAGTLASLGVDGPRVATLLAAELDLPESELPWHTSRLRLIHLAGALAAASAATGKIARDITLLAQSEVAEVREGTAPDDSAGGAASAGAAGPGSAAPAGGATRQGGSSAMPHKHNPVASIAILGCTKQVPGLVATVIAAAEQEHQRAAGAWHAEWQPLSALLQLTASAASWCEDLLAGLDVDAAAMRANLDAAGGLPMSEHVTELLAARLGSLAAHDLVADAAASGRPFRAALAEATDALTAEEIDAALDPTGYLGAAGEFTRRALAVHRRDHPH